MCKTQSIHMRFDHLRFAIYKHEENENKEEEEEDEKVENQQNLHFCIRKI